MLPLPAKAERPLVGEGQLLAEFVAHADAAGERTITTRLALEWARIPRGGSSNY